MFRSLPFRNGRGRGAALMGLQDYWLGVVLGGAAGAMLRLLCLTLGEHFLHSQPTGIVVGNAIATIAAGAVLSSGASLGLVVTLVGGVAGGMGTLSTLCTILVAYVLNKNYLRAFLYLLINSVAGMICIFIGRELGSMAGCVE